MLYQAGDKIAFGALYVDSDGASLTGLTVTINIWRVDIDNGTATQVVTNGSVSEAGNGIYYYIYTTPASGNFQFFAVFDEASGNAQARNLGATAQSGAPWVERIDTPLSDLTPAEVWSYATRTLTANVGGVTVISAVDGSTITVYADSTWRFTVTDSNLDTSDYEMLAFGVKRSIDDDDDEAILLVRSDTGLQRIGGAAPSSASNGSLTYTATSFTVVVAMAETGIDQRGIYTWFLKGFDMSVMPNTGFILATGDFVVNGPGVAATS